MCVILHIRACYFCEAIQPLLAVCQQSDLNHFYYTCLALQLLNDFFFVSTYDELSPDDLYYRYWEEYSLYHLMGICW